MKFIFLSFLLIALNFAYGQNGDVQILKYTNYNTPNFFLKVGDFRTRLEAEKIKSEIEAEFPTSFVVREKINLPRLDKDTDK